jgi:hypothetical protein
MPDGTGRMTFKKSKNIEIAGEPITGSANRRIGATPAQSGSTKAADDAQLQLVKQVMESKEKDTQRLWAEQQEMKKLLLHTMSKNDNGIKDVVATALTGGGDLRRELMEERRLQEERIRAEREERQRELDRLATERKRELEMAQAQHGVGIEIGMVHATADSEPGLLAGRQPDAQAVVAEGLHLRPEGAAEGLHGGAPHAVLKGMGSSLSPCLESRPVFRPS